MYEDHSTPDTPLKKTVGFVWYFVSRYPMRSVVMVVLLCASGVAEGVGVVSLLPVLELAGGGGQAESTIGQMMTGLIETAGISATLPALLGLLVTAMTIKAVLLWVAMRSIGYTVANVSADLRLDILDSLLHARWRAFADISKGELANTMNTEVRRASRGFRESADMLANSILILVYALASFLMSWKATVFALVAGGVFLLMFDRMVAMSQSAGKKQTDTLKSLTGRFVDTLSGMKAIKAMALESQVFPLLKASTHEYADAEKEMVIATETQKTFKEPVFAFFLAVGIFGLVSIGTSISRVLVLAFIAYRLLGMTANVQNRLQSIVNCESAFWSLMEKVRELEAQAESSTGKRVPPPLEKGIRFDAVDFSYGEDAVLSGLDLFVPRGEFVALTGESGAGKTTIGDLILGLHSPDRGSIYIDDVPLSDISMDDWRSRIGYVPQESMLLHDTILTNLTLNDPRYSREQAKEALEAADALGFVMSKPEGLDTIVGESGAKLSGGQQQRIALARALIRDPDLLLLDEPTTALDPETEQRICSTLTDLSGAYTILAISHQSAIQDVATVVLHLREGTVERHESQRAGTGALG